MGGALPHGGEAWGAPAQEWGPLILTQVAPSMALVLLSGLSPFPTSTAQRSHGTVMPRHSWSARHTSACTARRTPGHNTQCASRPLNVPGRGFLRTVWGTFQNSRFQLWLRARGPGAGPAPAGAGEPGDRARELLSPLQKRAVRPQVSAVLVRGPRLQPETHRGGVSRGERQEPS